MSWKVKTGQKRIFREKNIFFEKSREFTTDRSTRQIFAPVCEFTRNLTLGASQAPNCVYWTQQSFQPTG
jgi:hypothetical protein